MFIVGIAGGSGSGKTTFTKKVIERLDSKDVAILSMDSYYLPDQPESNQTDSGKANFDHPEAFDWELLFKHLFQLKSGNSIQSPIYDFSMSKRVTNDSTTIAPTKVLVFEGIFALYDKRIREISDIKCFLNVDADIRFIRRLHRDIQERGRSMNSVISQYYDTVRPMYQKYLHPQKQFADFIIGEESDTAADILCAKLIEQCSGKSDISKLKPQNIKLETENLRNFLS